MKLFILIFSINLNVDNNKDIINLAFLENNSSILKLK